MSTVEERGEEISTLIPVSEDPFCREAQLTSLDADITPTHRFYIRSHFGGVPTLDPASWRLEVTGAVDYPTCLTLDQIKAMSDRQSAVTLECAGNSRSYLTPPAEGLSFGHGAVSTARWKGVPVASLLETAGVQPSATGVIFVGADSGEEEEHGVAFGLDYRRTVPLDTALRQDTLLAYEMNGESLTPMHGFPLRAIVPRWYAMNSVKWLVRLEVTDRPFEGFFQNRRYVLINEGEEHQEPREPVTLMRVKSLITFPRHGEVVQPGTVTLMGYAWSGEAAIIRVEVSTTGGRTWSDAALSDAPGENAWRPWRFQWNAGHAGHYIMKVRATDASGRTQPDSIPWNFRGYANNSIQTIAVEVPSTSDPHP